jgi:hypothetical protein
MGKSPFFIGEITIFHGKITIVQGKIIIFSGENHLFTRPGQWQNVAKSKSRESWRPGPFPKWQRPAQGLEVPHGLMIGSMDVSIDLYNIIYFKYIYIYIGNISSIVL